MTRPMTRKAGLPLITTRRAALAALALPAIIGQVSAQALRPITLTLPWLAEGSNLFAHVAKARGFFAEVGLDVTISRGFGSVAAAQAVGAGRFDFGFAAPTAMLQQVAKGLPMVAFATLGYDATMGVAVAANGPIRTPADLAGKSLAGTVTSGEYPFLPGWARRVGLDIAAVRMIQTEPNLRQRLLVERQADATCGFANSMAPVFGALNFPARYMLFSQAGMQFYANVLMTQPTRFRAEPQVCAGMATALLRGIKHVMLDPEDAMRLFFQEVPEAALAPGAREQLRVGLGLYRSSMIDDAAKQGGLGFTPDGAWDAMTELVMEYVAQPGDARPARAQTLHNGLVGGVTLNAEEWARVTASTAEFRTILGV